MFIVYLNHWASSYSYKVLNISKSTYAPTQVLIVEVFTT